MNKPYYYRNFFLTDWRSKSLKNTIDLLLFYIEHFYGFSESNISWRFCGEIASHLCSLVEIRLNAVVYVKELGGGRHWICDSVYWQRCQEFHGSSLKITNSRFSRSKCIGSLPITQHFILPHRLFFITFTVKRPSVRKKFC